MLPSTPRASPDPGSPTRSQWWLPLWPGQHGLTDRFPRKLKQKHVQNSMVEWCTDTQLYYIINHPKWYPCLLHSVRNSVHFLSLQTGKRKFLKWPVQDKLNNLSNNFWKAKFLFWHFNDLSPPVSWHTSVLVCLCPPWVYCHHLLNVVPQSTLEQCRLWELKLKTLLSALHVHFCSLPVIPGIQHRLLSSSCEFLEITPDCGNCPKTSLLLRLP